MKPVTASNYQTAEQALEVILKANNLGQSVKVDANGNVINAAASSNSGVAKAPSYSNPIKNFFLFFRQKSKPADLQPSQQPSDVIWIVINKMKIEIGTASTFMKENSSLSIPTPGKIIDKYIPNAVNIHTKAEISNLHAKWLAIQKDIAGAKDGIQTSMDRLETSRYTKISTTDRKPINIPERVKESKQISTDLIADQQIAEANLCLPASMPKIKNTGEVVKGTLTIPPEEQLNLFNEWPEWDTHHNSVGKTSGDPFIGLSKAFQKDADRMTYVFESKGVAVECDRDKESVVIGFKQIAGKNPIRQLILSHLIGQQPVKKMYDAIERANPSSDGRLTILPSTGIPGDSKTKIHMTVHDSGDVEIDYLYLKKSQVISNIQIQADINRSKKFDGPLSQENAATYMTMKILLKNSALNRGELKFTIIEPLKLNVQLEIPNITNDA
jgi:hypothetical protein